SDRSTGRRYPNAPARQFAFYVGNNVAGGPNHKTDQFRGRSDVTRQCTGTLGRGGDIYRSTVEFSILCIRPPCGATSVRLGAVQALQPVLRWVVERARLP